MVALCLAVSHFSLASAQAPVAALFCWCCSPTRPARDVACPPCARGEERWHGQQNTVLYDDCSAARKGRPLVILCAPAAPASPVGSVHPDTRRARTGSM